MHHRRDFLKWTTSLAGAATIAPWELGRLCADERIISGKLSIAPFRYDVTPPLGHSLCGGWIEPVIGYDDELEALGYVLLGAGAPIVICSVDWCSILNSAHLQWREALAEGAGTTVDRVAVHTVHQHNAPFACLDANEIVSKFPELPQIVDPDFFAQCLERGRDAVAEAIRNPIPVTHVAADQARVHRVAANRRMLGPDGIVTSMRGSSSRSPEHHRLPEGLIDPWLKTIAFFNGDQKVVSSHYYACHPMSYYGDGRVSADFCGLARRERQSAEPDCLHLYFNGCGGNIGAGKYNDGSPPMREALKSRILKGIVASEEALVPQPIERVAWRTQEILPIPLAQYDEESLTAQISDANRSGVDRSRPAFTLAWLRRHASGTPIDLSSLEINEIAMLHLPAECFIEYQLRAQEMRSDRFVACAAYGDGGPWYIPTQEAYPQGGYEVSVAWCDPDIDRVLTDGIQRLLW